MKPAKRKSILEKEFGLCYGFEAWLYTSSCLVIHSYADLYDALTQILTICTWDEYSMICFDVSDRGVMVLLNSSPPWALVVEESDWDDADEFMDQLLNSGEWRMTEIDDGPYVLISADYHMEILIALEGQDDRIPGRQDARKLGPDLVHYFRM